MVKKNVIYTKGGDKGETSLLGNIRVLKDSDRIECNGNIDEVQANIGYLRAKINQIAGMNIYSDLLLRIQSEIIKIMGYIATTGGDDYLNKLDFLNETVSLLEDQIDKLEEELPEISGFIIPGKNELSSLAHITRTITRRAERRIVALSKKEKIGNGVIQYFNRLSDFLFQFARLLEIS